MKIKIYLSKQGYDKKPDKSASIIKTVSTYELVDITPYELYQQLTNGHYIHNECGYNESNNGSKCYTFKKSFLKQTQILCIDLDYKLKETKPNGKIIIRHYEPNEMPNWNNEILSDLKYTNTQGQEINVSPTFWMESFSAHKETEKKIVANSVHLFYVFEDPIYDVADFEKTAISIMYAVYRALKENGYDIPLDERCPFDPVSKDMFQGLWGSYNKAHNWNGNTYFWDIFKGAYTPEIKDIIFPKNEDETNELTEDEIKRTISAYSTVKSIDDIDISKSQYIKYKQYFGHQETFHIISVLKHEYSRIEENVNNKQSLCYQVCKKLLLEHSNDFFNNDENTFYREYKRQKIYNKKGSDEAAYLNHVIRLIGDTGAIPMIEYKHKENIANNVIKLDKTEYLSDKKDEIEKLFDNEKINFIVAEPGLGKTVFAKSLNGNILIIELFNSIIQSEEKFPSFDGVDGFTKFYGDVYIKSDKITRLNVCSANKFVSWVSDGDCSKYGIDVLDNGCLFDNIILDESHLLCLSNYRYDVMGDTVKYIKELKNDYPETNIILMTGTPFGESFLFDNLNSIKIETEPRFVKKFHMIQTSSIEGYIFELIKETISKGLRVFIPVDSENWFDTFIDSCVEEGIITKDKTYYFNQPKNTEQTEQYILNTKLIGDIQILGTSSYMSVGIDLEDWKTEFVTIIPSGASQTGNFCGLEVEQFANRHRKQNLNVYYVISKNENNNKKPIYSTSCRALLNIKNDILKSIYRTDPIVIKLPQYLIKNKSDKLEVHEDMFNVYVYYKDMKPYISHPKVIYEYMESIKWICDWQTVDHPERGINTKEHNDIKKSVAVQEFMCLLNEWYDGNYPIINVQNSISQDFELIKHTSKSSLFDVENIEVGFTTYYAKNTLFGEFLTIREYLTGLGTYNLIKDAYDGTKINMSFLTRTLHAIKLVYTYTKTGIWNEISKRLSEFYSDYSTIDNGVYKDNKKEFEAKRNKVVQEIWDELCARVDEENLQLALKSNYEGITENIIDSFMEGVKLIQTMYLDKKTIQRKINGKNVKVSVYNWNDNLLSKYQIRTDIDQSSKI